MHRSPNALTLAEVLIGLAVVAVIATLTIPKLLKSNSEERLNNMAHQTIAALSQAHTNMRLKREFKSNVTTGSDMIERYLNATEDTTSRTDYFYAGTAPIGQCSEAARICYRMPNGVMITSKPDTRYVKSATYAMFFALDVDGVPSGANTRPGEVVGLYIYPDGRILTSANMDIPTRYRYVDGSTVVDNTRLADPPWFHW